MRWATIFLYLYVAQAAAGAAIGFAVPFLYPIGERGDAQVGEPAEITGSIQGQ
jgi:hypothetical protein